METGWCGISRDVDAMPVCCGEDQAADFYRLLYYVPPLTCDLWVGGALVESPGGEPGLSITAWTAPGHRDPDKQSDKMGQHKFVQPQEERNRK